MKYLISIMLFIIPLLVLGQKEAIPTIRFVGIINEAATNEPIPFATISINSNLTAVSDFEGEFAIELPFDTIAYAKVTAIGYEKKELRNVSVANLKIIELTPISLSAISEFDSKFIIWGRPIDTTFYKSGAIQKIRCTGRDEKNFFPQGNVKSEEVNDSYREWHENGKLKYQSIAMNPHLLYISEWYSNGQLRMQGSKHWGHNDKTNSGDWFKNNDWRYWNRKGQQIKNYR